jgi:hypothetical protein
MAVGKLFHAYVPALAAPEVEQLLDDNRKVLAGNGRHRSIGLTAAIRPVT